MLFYTLLRLAQLQHQSMDRLALQAAFDKAKAHGKEGAEALQLTLADLHLPPARWLDSSRVDESALPALACGDDGVFFILRGRNAQGGWVAEFWDAQHHAWTERTLDTVRHERLAKLVLARPFEASNSAMWRLIRDAVFVHRITLVEIVLGGLVMNMLALAISLYSMQVYDRVVPAGATQTLFVLTLGVMGAIVFELMVKFVRANLNEKMVDQVDAYLARLVYSRLLKVRMDQLPQSVGALAGQIKGYETVRAFLAAVPTQLFIDLPFVLVYTLIVVLIAGHIGLIPLVFLMFSLGIGMIFHRKIESLTQKTTQASHLKMGLLVETIEGAETIKSGQGGWRMLQRWLSISDAARDNELDMRQVSDHSQYWIAALHQMSYVLMVAFGALLIVKGELSLGGLIACSILSGRILGPVSTLPNWMVQWGHCRAALQGLDKIWSLEDDHAGVDHPIALSGLQGAFDFDDVVFSYDNSKALSISKLQFKPGEKIGILGPIGAGKTSLLRLLSGMYRPQQGCVRLDGVDLSHIAKPVLADQMGFLQQEGRLFAGTLRDNLILGLLDPGDQAILNAAKITGLDEAVIAQHAKGLHRPIAEGGQGLSGGQKQLVNLTRVFLRKPRIWLLDEPTASMDRNLELKVMRALAQHVQPQDTLVIVTHKPEMLQLVDRLLVVANHAVLLDGPKAEVMQRLQSVQAQSMSSVTVSHS
jgi:ATP-binding cassette subfamily C protein LapB